MMYIVTSWKDIFLIVCDSKSENSGIQGMILVLKERVATSVHDIEYRSSSIAGSLSPTKSQNFFLVQSSPLRGLCLSPNLKLDIIPSIESAPHTHLKLNFVQYNPVHSLKRIWQLLFTLAVCMVTSNGSQNGNTSTPISMAPLSKTEGSGQGKI